MIQHRVSLFDRLFTSTHIELLHAALQDFSSRFGTVDRNINFLIGHYCIVTKKYYFHVFLSHSVLVLSFYVRSQSHPRRALRVPNKNQAKLVALKWPNALKMTSKWSVLASILVSTVSFVWSECKQLRKKSACVSVFPHCSWLNSQMFCWITLIC